MYYALRERVHELLILIMAVLAKVGWLHICERLPSVLVRRPMPLLLLYRAPSFGCSLLFVHRELCKNCSIDVCGRTQCLHVNLYGSQLLYSSRKFGQVFLTRTVIQYYSVLRTVHPQLLESRLSDTSIIQTP